MFGQMAAGGAAHDACRVGEPTYCHGHGMGHVDDGRRGSQGPRGAAAASQRAGGQAGERAIGGAGGIFISSRRRAMAGNGRLMGSSDSRYGAVTSLAWHPCPRCPLPTAAGLSGQGRQGSRLAAGRDAQPAAGKPSAPVGGSNGAAACDKRHPGRLAARRRPWQPERPRRRRGSRSAERGGEREPAVRRGCRAPAAAQRTEDGWQA